MIDTPTTSPAWSHRIAVFDLETTGVDVRQDRIVTAHIGVLDGDGRVLSADDWLLDPGIEIPAASTTVHGVTTEYARTHGRDAAEAIGEICDRLRRLLAEGTPVCAYNASFDLSLLAAEAQRYGCLPLASPAPIIDPLIIDKAVDRYRRGKRTLELVAAHYGVALENAHEASSDAIAAGRIALALAARFGDELPEDAPSLHAAQQQWAREQAAGLTEYLLRVGRLAAGDSVDGGWPVR